MSYYEEENDNLCQKTEGFNSGYDCDDNQYVLTPEESEKAPVESELDEDIYDEQQDEQQDDAQVQVEQDNVLDSDVHQLFTAPSPAPVVKKKSKVCMYDWVMAPDNRKTVLMCVFALLVLLYFLNSENIVTLPNIPTMSGLSSALGIDSITSSFGASSASLGSNVGRMTNTLF
jgi:hypothetical protein